MAGSSCEPALSAEDSGHYNVACVCAVACAVLSAFSRAFYDGNSACGDENSGGRDNKFVNGVCAIAKQTCGANPKGQMDVIQSCNV